MNREIMRKIAYIFLALVLMLGRAWAQEGMEMPAFSKFYDKDTGLPFTRDSLNRSNQQVLIFYDPGCGHCQELGQGIAKRLDTFAADVDFYFISMQEKPLVDGFVNMFAPQLAKDKRVKFLYDPEGEFILMFNPKNFPSTAVFRADSLQLIKQFDGEGKVENIAQYLQKAN